MLRVVNYLKHLYNYWKLKCYGVRIGKNCIVHGSLGIKLASTSKLVIGENFYMSNGAHLNPLARNLQGSFCVEEDATILIGNNVGLSSVVLWASRSIIIGNNVKIGANTIVLDSDAHSLDYLLRRDVNTDLKSKCSKQIIIEDDVLIGTNSIILKGVTIGARSIIGAGSVVAKSIPPDCIACGNPAKIVKYL